MEIKNTPTKIALVAPIPPPYGGIANWVVILSEYVKQQTQVEFTHINISPKKRGVDGGTLLGRIVGQGIAMFSQKKKLKTAINKKRIDVIHMTTSGHLAVIRDIQMLKLAKKKKIPTVYHLHFGRIPEISKNNTKEWKLYKYAMRLASCVMAIDKKTYATIREYLPDINVCYVPNPFDVVKMRNFMQSVDNHQEIVYLGWLIKLKGVEELLTAWSKVRKDNPMWKLKLIGPYEEAYYETLKNKFSFEQVIFEGEQSHENAMKMLSKASVFILPSYSEGFPNVVLEAMALGKPIIATDVGAIPNMLQDCGVVIPVRDTKAIEDGLNLLLNNGVLRRELGNKAQEKLLKEYTLEKIGKEYIRIWNEVAQL